MEAAAERPDALIAGAQNSKAVAAEHVTLLGVGWAVSNPSDISTTVEPTLILLVPLSA